ncbi:MAG: hypothetical protein ABJB86_12075 [Bacteroidota bacterium]
MHRNVLFTRKDADKGSENAAPCINFSAKTHEENLCDQLLAKGYSKQDIHSAMYKYMLLQIQHKKATGNKRIALHEKPSLCSKATHFLKSLVSAMVSLIKTQFAKKPKNPV